MPLQEAVQGQEARAKFPNVYRRVILGIICFYAFFGIICWMGFGNDVNTVLTVSLPAGYLATSVQFAYSIAVSVYIHDVWRLQDAQCFCILHH